MSNQSQWRLGHFFFGQLLAILLLSSWLFKNTPVYEMWEQIDQTVFFVLNGFLEKDHFNQVFWAIANNRLFDLVGAGLFGIIFVHFILSHQRKFSAERIGLFFFLLVYSILLVVLVNIVFQSIERASPSNILNPAYKLSQLVPHIKAKDGSGVSFPSDHAIQLFMWSGFYLLFLGRRQGILAMILALILTTPRLVSGAHWFTDNFVGGLGVALIGFTWIATTPLKSKATVLFTPFGRKLEPILIRPLVWMRIIR